MRTLLLQVYALTVKDLRRLSRDRSGLIVLFAMPAMFILVMSVALQGVFQAGTAERPIVLPVVNLDTGVETPDGQTLRLGAQVVQTLADLEGLAVRQTHDGAPLTQEQAEALVAAGEAPVALVLPPDFSRAVVQAAQGGPPPAVTFIVDPGAGSRVLAPIRAGVTGLVERLVAQARAPYQAQAALEAAAADLPHPLPAWWPQLAARLARAWAAHLTEAPAAPAVQVRVHTPAAFTAEPLPDSVQQNVPGYTVFGVFFIIGIVAASVLDERKRGTLHRLQAAPFSRAAFLLGKVVPYFLVNLVQIALMFGLGRAVFHLNLGPDPLGLALVSLAAAAKATGLGLLVAAWSRTDGQAGGLSTLLALVLAALGGMMVPTYVMPTWMQHLARLSPHYWALQGYQDLMVRGLHTVDILPEVGVLALFAGICYTGAVWRFRLTL